jgi:DNA-binding transcriptional regulator YhcF (GntR family)
MSSPPVIAIDLDSPVPAYRQIVDALRAVLVAGDFEPGDQLPTVRQLAMDLGVHHNTVAEAYRLLADEGWLDLRRRRGVTVLARSTPVAQPEALDGFRTRLRHLAAEVTAQGLSRAAVARELRRLASSLATE